MQHAGSRLFKQANKISQKGSASKRAIKYKASIFFSAGFAGSGCSASLCLESLDLPTGFFFQSVVDTKVSPFRKWYTSFVG